jgi:hypothetical protein
MMVDVDGGLNLVADIPAPLPLVAVDRESNPIIPTDLETCREGEKGAARCSKSRKRFAARATSISGIVPEKLLGRQY